MKMGKKEKLSKLIYYLNTLSICKWFATNRLVVFNYHRIKPDIYDKSHCVFDEGVFGPNQTLFHRQIKWLKKNTVVLSEADLMDILKSGIYPKKICSLITFDDGYEDNYSLAFPVLSDLNVSAIFFVTTSLINERKVGWWDIIAYLINKTTKENIYFNGKNIQISPNSNEAIRKFLNCEKSNPHVINDSYINELSNACEVPLPSFEMQDSQLMTWEEIKTISRSRCSIGSHCHTHQMLSSLDSFSQKTEMQISKSIIEQEIGKEIFSISYPVGGYQHINNDSKKQAEMCGYKLGFSFLTGINTWDDINSFDIKRISVPASFEMFVSRIVLPKLFR
jgi:peptidoglycan/xylan/chitin deacetylase (PgdA/CDA1 family)